MRKTLVSIVLGGLLLTVPALAADQNWEAGVQAFQSGNFAAAVTAFQKYVAENSNFEGHMMLGQALLKTKQYGQAATHLQKANELKAGDAGVQLALGQALLKSGKAADACRALAAVNEGALPKANQAALYQMRAAASCGGSGTADLKKVAESKNDATSWAAYGVAALNQGETASAVSALDRAVRLAPNDQKIRKGHVSALIRQARTTSGGQKQQIYGKAVTSAQELVELDASFENLLTLGEVHLGAKNYAAAVSSLQRASTKDPSNWLPYYYLGQANTQLEKYADAMTPLEKARQYARSTDDRNKVLSALGFVHEKQKEYAEAIRYYEQAGDQGSVARVRKNQETEQFNAEVERHNQILEEMKVEEERLKKEMEEIESGPPPK